MPREVEEILIVDDSPSIRNSMSMALKEMGYRVRAAEDGFAALREVRGGIPDILLSDLNMPGMSGFELLSVLRRRFPEIKLIAMSGAFSPGETPHDVVADAFFQKGQGLDALMRVIRTLAAAERDSRGSSPSSSRVLHLGMEDSLDCTQAAFSCPECLRTISQPSGHGEGQELETQCIHCGSPFRSSTNQNRSQSALMKFQSRGARLSSGGMGSCPGTENPPREVSNAHDR